MRALSRSEVKGCHFRVERLSSLWLVLGILPLVALLAGCCCFGGRSKQYVPPPQAQPDMRGVNVYVAPIPSAVRSVAVMPFQASTELVGVSTSDLFVTELLRTARYQMLERAQLSQVLNEAEVALSGISESQAVELGNMLGADGVIIGTVDEYGTIAHKGGTKAVVGLSVRLIECDSGRVLWSASFASTANDAQIPISQHCRVVVRSTVMALRRAWHVQRQISKDGPNESGPQDLSPRVDQNRPEPPQPPVAPVFTLSDFGLREVEIKWSAPQSAGLQFAIERAAAPDGPFAKVATVAATRGSHTDRGTLSLPLSDGSTYYYRLKAIAATGLASGYSEIRESMTAPAPSPPSELGASVPAGRAVALTWKKSDALGFSKYIVERADPPEYAFNPIAEVAESEFKEGGTPASPLQDSTVYRYRVRVDNRVGAISEPSRAVEIETLPPPSVVQGLVAVSRHPRRVPLAWEPSDEADVVRYEIGRAESDAGPFEEIASLAGRETCEYVDEGDKGSGWRASRIPLLDDARYYYRIRAVNDVESFSVWSSLADAVTKAVPVLPRGLKASAGGVGLINVGWQPNPEADIVAYLVSVSSSEASGYRNLGRLEIEKNVDLSFTEDSLSPGLTRYYRIRALDVDGLESEWSPPVSGSTKPAPDAPTEIQPVWNGEAVHLTWTAPIQDDVVQYKIWEKRMLFGERELLTVDEQKCSLSAEQIGRSIKIAVTAIDDDGLESELSEFVEIRRP